MATESVLGERFNIATRHELADRITAALDAATSSPTPAESVCAKCGGSGEIEIGCAMDHALTAPCVECRGTGTVTATPPESTRAAGEQEQVVVIDGERRRVIPCPDGREDCEVLHMEPITTTSDSARRAAEEICAYFGDTDLAMDGHVNANGVAAIISKHFPLAVAPADNDAESLLAKVIAIVEATRNSSLWNCNAYPQALTDTIEKLKVLTTTKGDR